MIKSRTSGQNSFSRANGKGLSIPVNKLAICMNGILIGMAEAKQFSYTSNRSSSPGTYVFTSSTSASASYHWR